ncbi:Tethering factor for nuclear proteasome sts1 [Apophysomyces sp. BC1034]|nr:Tethering factor for nuclear proteasome sts1 [Apophysomyces sp. BC1015]KAG0181788.1 Tethering factor for nuclear proteasome sts1 [Apophysomyces sp. BC1021]KAG0192502.1 Tethering factor for nuclear proteasome sts1 [Apophysomyces sp. BC1034]
MAAIFSSSPKDMTKGRKRRLSEDEDMSDAPSINTTRSIVERHQQRRSMKTTSDIKRYKTGIQRRSANTALLATMDKDKLIDLIHSLLLAHPEVREDIVTYIPPPTIPSATAALSDLERRLADSFPYNRHGPRRDDYTFSRVREPLTGLIDTVAQYANHFTSTAVFPTICFSFLDLATHVAHRLPTWENEDHNQLKRELYHDLNDCWKKAIVTAASKMRERESYSPQTVSEWAKSLAQHNSYTEGLFTDAVHEFTKQLGFMIGLSVESVDPPRDAPLCHLPSLESDMARFAPQSPVVGYADVRR